MKNKKEKFLITADDIKTDFNSYNDFYADHLKNNPDELRYYKKFIIKKYNQTKDETAFLAGMRIVAMAEGKMSAIAKKAKLTRTSVYRMLTENANPSFANVMASADVLGIKFNACLAR